MEACTFPICARKEINWLEAIDELITIAKEAGLPAEIYHLKAGGKTQLVQNMKLL